MLLGTKTKCILNGTQYQWNCAPPPPPCKLCGSFNPSTSECDLIGEQNLQRSNQVEMRPSGWVLIHDAQCPYTKRKFGHKHREAARQGLNQRSKPRNVKSCRPPPAAGRAGKPSTQSLRGSVAVQPRELEIIRVSFQTTQYVVLGYGSLS